MAANVFCGNCGALLEGTGADCWHCGARYWAPGGHRRKSPLLAAALAVVPGLGHLYLGQWPKAALFLAGCGALEFLGFDLDLTGIGDAVGLPMGLGGLGLWAFSIADAFNTARRLNRVERA